MEDRSKICSAGSCSDSKNIFEAHVGLPYDVPTCLSPGRGPTMGLLTMRDRVRGDGCRVDAGRLPTGTGRIAALAPPVASASTACVGGSAGVMAAVAGLPSVAEVEAWKAQVKEFGNHIRQEVLVKAPTYPSSLRGPSSTAALPVARVGAGAGAGATSLEEPRLLAGPIGGLSGGGS